VGGSTTPACPPPRPHHPRRSLPPVFRKRSARESALPPLSAAGVGRSRAVWAGAPHGQLLHHHPRAHGSARARRAVAQRRMAGSACDPGNVPREPGQHHEAMVQRSLPLHAPWRTERLGNGPLLDRLLLQPQCELDHRVPAELHERGGSAPLSARGVSRPRPRFLQSQLLSPIGPCPGRSAMKIIRLYADDKGESHFQDIEVELEAPTPSGRVSARQPATGIIFREVPGEYDLDWHPAPRRQYIINLDAGVQLTAGDGEVRRVKAGEVVLVEDTWGKGHLSKAIENKTRHCIFVPID